MKKFKIFSLILSLSIFFAFLSAGFVLARELEVNYPSFGNTIGPTSTRTLLPYFVKYLFNFAIAVSGLVIFGVMIFAGFRLTTSAGNPSAMSDAKDRIFSAIIGSIIILGSYLLLTTINPSLTLINPILSTNEGVVVYASANCGGEKAQGTPENTELKPGKDYIKLGVSSRTLERLTPLSVWLLKPASELEVKLYPNENWDGAGVPVEGQANSCVLSPLTTAQSIELNWQNPGVYLCKDAKTCSVYNFSQSKLADGFEDEITGIRFQNPRIYDNTIASPTECQLKLGPGPDGKGVFFTTDNEGKTLEKPTCLYYTYAYGAVLHEGRNYKDTCDVFFNVAGFPASPKIDDIFPGDGVSSITVFLQPQPGEMPQGTGVTLYENIEYNQKDPVKEKGGQVTLKPKPDNYPDFGAINWSNGVAGTIGGKVSSVKIDGNYLAVLFNDGVFHNKCEVFRDNDPNLNNNFIGEDNSQSAKIIPIKK